MTDKEVHIENYAKEHHEDTCTPLCACICCNTVITVSDEFVFRFITDYKNLDISESIHPNYIFSDNTSPPPKS
ncbi:MAG: hypothetical protein ABI528_05405 [bacterium]